MKELDSKVTKSYNSQQALFLLLSSSGLWEAQQLHGTQLSYFCVLRHPYGVIRRTTSHREEEKIKVHIVLLVLVHSGWT